MISLHPRRLLRWTLWLSLALVVLIAAALFVAPRLLDLPVVRAKLERQVSEAAQGRLAWDAWEVRLLPAPRGILRGVRIEIPEVLSGRVDEVELHLRLWALLAGRVEVQTARVVRPVLRVTIPKPERAQPTTPTDPITAYRNAMQPVVDAVRRFAPALTLSIEDAEIEVIAPGLPALGPVNLALQGRTDAGGIELGATGTGRLWKQVRAKARLEYASLEARVELDGAEFKPQPLLDHFLAGAVVTIGLQTGDVHVEARTDGRSALTAAVTTDIPALAVVRNDVRVELSAVHAAAGVAAHGQDLELTLSAVRLGELVPLAKGRLQLTGAQQQAEASLEVPALDLARLRDAATTLAGDHRIVRDYVTRVHGGQLADLHLTAQAQSLAGLADPAAVDASLKLERGAMLVPYLEQEVADISGALAWSKGTLSARGVSGRLGQTRVADGSVDYRLRDGQISIGLGYDLDLAQGLDLARQLLPQAKRATLDVVRAVTGRAQGRLAAAFKPGGWSADLALTRSDSMLRLRDVPWPVSLREGRVAATPKRVTVTGAGGAVGSSTFSDVGVGLATDGPPRLDTARGSARLAVAELYRWLREQPGLAASLRRITAVNGNVEVTVNRVAGRIDQLDSLHYDATLQPRNVRVELTDLPAPVAINGGSINATPQALRFDGVMPSLLDARVRVSGVAHDYRTDAVQVDATLADGETGEAFMTWAWGRSGAPARLQPKTPMRFAAERVRWSRRAGVDLRASAQLTDVPSVEADLAWNADALDVRRAHIKDRESDATLSLMTRGRLLDTRFSGVLTGRSVASLFAQSAGERTGRVEGDFRATIDRDRRGRSTARGRLTGQQIQLERLLGLPLKVERIDLDADDVRLRVNEVSIEYADQKATIRGEVGHGASGPVIDAQIDSPGIVVDALLPLHHEGEPDAAPTLSRGTSEALAIWPLPVEGKLSLRTGFVEYQRYRVEPLVATIDVDSERARMEVAEARLCGMAFPFTLELTRQGAVGSVQIRAKGQQLEATVRCLSDQRALLTGEFDLYADLRTAGKRGQLVRNLEGSVEFHARRGEIKKWGLLGNILALKSISHLLTKGGAPLDEAGFDYREIAVRGRLTAGRFEVEEGAFDSPALGLAATGSVRLEDRDAELIVLVAPFSRIDRLVRRVPIVGYILGGTFTSIPVGVRGDISDPLVTPLGPKAVTSELVGIFERTFKLPGKLFTPLQEATRPAEGTR